MRLTINITRTLSLVVSALIMSSAFITGLAAGQQYGTDYTGGNYAGGQSAAGDYDAPPLTAASDSDILIIPGAEGIKGFTTGRTGSALRSSLCHSRTIN